MATWPCPRCDRPGEIDTDGPYYQAGGRSMFCDECGAHFQYGDSALSPSKPAPRPWEPVQPVAERQYQVSRRELALVMLVGGAATVANLLLVLFSDGWHEPLLFVVGPPVFYGGLVGFLGTYWTTRSELRNAMGCPVLLGGLVVFAVGVALALAPVDILQWVGLMGR